MGLGLGGGGVGVSSSALASLGVSPSFDRRMSFFGDLVRMGDSIDLVVIGDSKIVDNSGYPGWVSRIKDRVITLAPSTTRVNYHTFNFGATPQRIDTVQSQAGTPRQPGFATGGASGRNGSRRLPTSVTQNFAADIDARVNFTPTNVPPTGNEALIAKGTTGGGGTTTGLVFFIRRLTTSGNYFFQAFPDTTTTTGNISDTLTAAEFGTVTAGAETMIRVTLDIDNGGGGYTVTWYRGSGTSILTATWTQVRQTVTAAGVFAWVNQTTAYWEIGARGNTTDLFQGSITEVDVRDGIASVNVTPFARQLLPTTADQWEPSSGNLMLDGGYDGTGGTINIYQMGYTGTKASQWIARPQMMPQINRGVVLFATADNQDEWASALSTAMDSLLTQLRVFYPLEIPIGYVPPNPNVSPFSNKVTQRARTQHIMRWAVKNSLPVIDVFNAFARLGDETAIGNYLRSDGQHTGDGTAGQSASDGIGVQYQTVAIALGLI